MRLSKTIEPIERLEVFCEKHGNMLFWNNQPNNQAEWNESFLQWALPRSPQKASTIARRRHERTYSLFRQLAQNKFRLTSELIKDLDDQSEQAIFNSLKLKLDQEEPPMDTYLLYNILCEMAKEGRTADNMTEEEATAYLSIIIAKARGASRSGSDAGNGPARDFLAEASSRWMDQEAAGVN
ncbi:hypothetical protein N7456_010963 [Penicillium angulare]|uniref:Uncharacterized protein n=1 Tax=Penicillium angulare TaxID=116970 RepID=A0A9W9K095_9EURO|nr:hypothetical protein N7456_010963 [Penicillium angulare]